MGYKLVQERGSRWVQVRGYRWEQVRGCKQELVKEYRESDYNWLLEMGCREMQALAGRPKAGCWQWLQPEAWVQGQLDLHCSWYGQQVLEKWLLQGCKQKPVALTFAELPHQGLACILSRSSGPRFGRNETAGWRTGGPTHQPHLPACFGF